MVREPDGDAAAEAAPDGSVPGEAPDGDGPGAVPDGDDGPGAAAAWDGAGNPGPSGAEQDGDLCRPTPSCYGTSTSCCSRGPTRPATIRSRNWGSQQVQEPLPQVQARELPQQVQERELPQQVQAPPLYGPTRRSQLPDVLLHCDGVWR